MKHMELSVMLTMTEEQVKKMVKKGDEVKFIYTQNSNNKSTQCSVTTKTGEMLGLVALSVGGALPNTVTFHELSTTYPEPQYIFGRVLAFEEKKNNANLPPQTMIRVEVVERTMIDGKPIITRQTAAFKRIKTKRNLNKELEAAITELQQTTKPNSEGPDVVLREENDKIVLIFKDEILGELKQVNGTTMNANEIARYVKASDDIIKGNAYELNTDTVFVEFEHIKIDIAAKEREKAQNLFVIEKQRLIDENILSESEIEDRLQLMEEYNLPLPTILDIFKSMKPMDEETKLLVPTKPTTTFKDYDDIMKQVFAFINVGSHLLLNGPSATGKNVAVRTIAYLLNRPLYEMSLNRQTDASDLLGDKTLTNHVVNPLLKQPNPQLSYQENLLSTLENMVSVLFAQNQKGQSVEFQAESFIKAMEKGAVFCFDEINTTSAALMSILNSALDARGSIYVPGYGYVQADPNFVAIGTMNVGAEYAGTSNLNQALNTRFTTVFFKYASNILEVLRSECPTALEEHIKKTNQVYASLVDAIEGEREPLPESCMNIRGFIRGLNTASVLGLKQALTTAVANSISDRFDRETVLSIIETHVVND